jgi:hypothetical protein
MGLTAKILGRLCKAELITKRPTLVFFFGSHETSSIIWLGEPAPAELIQSREKAETVFVNF